MIILPAIDIRGGQIVRLTRGDYDLMTVYGTDYSRVLSDFATSGARHLHIVDLDGAKDGALSNFTFIRDIVSASSLEVEVGGGIRDAARIERYLSLGVRRVILGTAAVENRTFLTDMLNEYGDAIAVGVDTHDGEVAVRGWLDKTGLSGVDFCRELAALGVKTVIYTDISRDGALQGTNLDVYRTLSDISGLDIIASGGVTHLEEIAKLRDMGISGAIIGKALYEGRLSLSDAVRIASGGSLC